MTADLPPHVRHFASKSARMAYAIAMNHNHDDPFLNVVDAVTSVVADVLLKAERERIVEKIKDMPSEWDSLGNRLVVGHEEVIEEVRDV
jgi:hypothetical protein